MATRTFTFDTTSDYPPTTDLVVNVGASFTCTYTVNIPSGAAYDFTGHTHLSAQMAKHVGSAATATFTVGFTSAASGEFQISLGSTATRALKKGRHVYDILVSSGSSIHRIVQGNMMVIAGVSSAP